MPKLYLHLKEKDEINTIIYDAEIENRTIKDLISYSISNFASRV